MVNFDDSRLDTVIEFSHFPRFTNMVIEEKISQNPRLRIISSCSFNTDHQVICLNNLKSS